MTGFARISGRAAGTVAWTLTLKSVNHRYLDLHLRMPAGSESLEMRLRQACKQKIVRGHIEATLVLERQSGAAAELDRELLHGYINTFREVAAKNGLTAEPDLNALLRFPGVLNGDGRPPADEMQSLERDVAGEIDSLINELNAMRAAEGATLAELLFSSLNRLELTVREIGRLRQDVQKAYFERINQRTSALLLATFDRDRLLQEAALIADRSDIQEEVVRMHGHIEHFRGLLLEGGEVGKKLDFLLQEMNREANTLLSKTSGISGNGQRITELGLEMKAEIEKAREQVQNLE